MLGVGCHINRLNLILICQQRRQFSLLASLISPALTLYTSRVLLHLRMSADRLFPDEGFWKSGYT